MKKAFMLVAAIAMIAAPIFAEDEVAAPTLGGLHAASGSVSFSFGDDDISDNAGLGFGSAADGTTASSVTASIATEKVEAGATISLIPTIEKVDGDDDKATSSDSTNIDLAKDLVAFYEDATDADYDDDYTFTAADWDTVIGNTDIYDSSTDDDWVDFDIDTEANWILLEAVYGDVNLEIMGEITTLGTTIGYTYATYALGAYYIDQFGRMINGADDTLVIAATNPATAAEIAEMDAVNAASADYDAVFEASTDDAYTASFPVSDAYLRLLAVGGVVDVEFELNGKAVGVGSKYSVAGDDANLGFGLALTAGVIEGLSVDALYTINPATANTDEDYETLGVDAADGDAAMHAIELNAGYATDLFSVAAGMAIEDLANAEIMWTLQAGLSMADLMGLGVNAEITGIGSAIGVAADASATIMGITPSVDFRLRSSLHNSADTVDDGTALDYFNSADEDNTYLGFGLSVDFAGLMGMSLITLNGSFGMVLSADNDFGVGIAFDLTELFAPVTVGFNIGQSYDDVLTWDGALGAAFFGITAGFTLAEVGGDNIEWGASLGYTYDILDIAAGFNSDEDAVKSFDITVSTSF